MRNGRILPTMNEILASELKENLEKQLEKEREIFNPENVVAIGPTGVGTNLVNHIKEILSTPPMPEEEHITDSVNKVNISVIDSEIHHEEKSIIDIITEDERRYKRIAQILDRNVPPMRCPLLHDTNGSIARNIYYSSETTIMDYPKKSKKNKFKKSRRK